MWRYSRTFYAIVSGLLLCLPWYGNFSVLFLCLAFVPLLFLEDSFSNNPNENSGRLVFLYASLAFLTWNTGATWWIANASLAGACTAILINTFLFSCVFYAYHFTRKATGDILGKIAFVCYWTAFEYFYLNAEISWPWLNLGNGLAFNSHFVQWYEYTGALGGTAWILAINLLFFEILKKIVFGNNRKKIYPALIAWFILLLAPILLSLSIYYRYQEKYRPVDIVVIQPNVDPYSTYIPPAVQCSNITTLIDSTGTDRANYFVAPETAIEDDVWENSIENNYSVSALTRFMKKFPSADLVYGSYTYKRYEADDTKTATAQWMKTPGFYFDSYNTALQIDTGKTIQKYHKSKLVVGIEKMPYSNTLKFLRKIVESFGGSFSSHGTQDFRSVFTSPGKETRIAPVICYESVYGEFVTGYINNGANLIFIITNDGWWGNTPGHRQHLAYASLRAIETRRSIARAANTGISAFINQRGDVVKTLEYGKKGTLECSLNANDEKTFYVKHGDYVGWIAAIISGCIALFTIITIALKRLKH